MPTPAKRCPKRLKWSERTPAAEGGTMGEKLPRILSKVATSTSLLGSFTCRKFTTWGRRLYFPSEGRRAEDFFARKIRRLRPGLNRRTWVLKASTLTSRSPKPLWSILLLGAIPGRTRDFPPPSFRLGVKSPCLQSNGNRSSFPELSRNLKL